MLYLVFLSLRVRFTTMSNRVLYFFRGLPGFKKILTKDVYASGGLKILFLILGMMFVINKKIMMFLLYAGLLLFFGIMLNAADLHGGIFRVLAASDAFHGVDAESVVGYMLMVWFVMSFLGAPALSVTVSSANHFNDDAMINIMRTDPSRYGKSRILADRVSDILILTPALILVFAVLFNSAWAVFMGVFQTLVRYTFFRLGAEVLNLWLFKRVGKHFGSNNLIAILPYLFVIVLSFALPYFFGLPNWEALFSFFMYGAVLYVSAGSVFIVYIARYPLYHELLSEKINRNKIAYAKANKAYTGFGPDPNAAKNWSDKINAADLAHDSHAAKSGFAYLNAVFFDRHKVFFTRRQFLRSSFFLLPIVGAAGIAVFSLITFGELPSSAFSDAGWLSDSSAFFAITPAFIFIIYFASMGRIVTGAVFSNCDIQMLHYTYYRQSATIMASFKARVKVIAGYNFALTLLLTVSVLGAIWIVFGYLNPVNALFFFLAVNLMGAFFSFNDLFLYYVIQPYDSAGKSKSPVYTVINIAVYIIAYIHTQFRFDLMPYTVILGTVTVLYVGIGAVLLKTYAPSRFRLR